MICLITGPMFSGKSKYLIKHLNYILLEEPFRKIVFIYPKKSYRGYFCRDKDIVLNKNIEIISEDEILEKCNNSEEEVKKLFSAYDYIGTDELCLFDESDFFTKLILSTSSYNHIVSSLDMNFQRKYWDCVLKLLESDKIDMHVKLTGLCECGKRGIYSKRMLKNNDKEIVIGDDIYKCVCKNCYEDGNKQLD